MKKLSWKDVSKKSVFSPSQKQESLEIIKNAQAFAVDALNFGIDINFDDYNVFVLGESGLGKHELVKNILNEKAEHEPVPDDYVYVYNFYEPSSPIFLNLPPGKAVMFAEEMGELVENLKIEIPKLFDSKDYEAEKNKIIETFQEFDRQIFEKLSEEARGRGFILQRNPDGFAFMAVKDNEPINDEKFSKLSEQEKKSIQDKIKHLQQHLKDNIKIIRNAEKDTKSKIAELEKRMGKTVIHYKMEELKEKFGCCKKVLNYLDTVEQDILNNLESFRQTEDQSTDNITKLFRHEASFLRYKVNVFVNRAFQQGAPVIYETNPTYPNLAGKIESRFQMGAAITDFTMIKPGVIHIANGGYLVVDALDLLKNPFSYEILIRALKIKQIKIEDPMESYRMSAGSLKPEPIPLKIKILLIGNPLYYYLLNRFDENFSKFFKVKVDLERDIDWDEKSEQLYACFITQTISKENLLQFDVSAVRSVIEYGGRLVDDQKKLSMKMEEIASLVKEASYIAEKNGNSEATAENVKQAILSKKKRHNKLERKIQEMLTREILLIDTKGKKVGCINGLSVYDLGDYRFGRPSKITAKSYIGKAGITYLDKEAKLSGKIHDKAAMVITAYLNSKFANKSSIEFSSTICFEQLYEMVEGDSASMAEAIVLQSAVGNIPIHQNIAITGSMNQHGTAQAIGGVNEKIEGFFEVCKEKGLDGSQGVVIPSANEQHLMLNEEVTEAVKSGQFSIYSVNHVEEALEILSGMKSGERNETGEYPDETANCAIEKAFNHLTELQKAKSKGKKDDEK